MMRRNREINIFNLSMMDVISGAMGAFLIVMVVLARYYESDPSSSQSVDELAEQIRRAIEQLDQAEDKLDTGLVNIPDLRKLLEETRLRLEDAERRLQDLRERLNQAAAQIERLNTAVDQLKAENATLKQENAALEAEVQRLRRQVQTLEQQLAQAIAERDQARAERDQAAAAAQQKAERRPFLVAMSWFNCQGADIDLYVRDTVATDKDGNRQEEVNPYKKQGIRWTGDTYRDAKSPATLAFSYETWLVRDAPIGTTFAVYYKLLGFDKDAPQNQRCNVYSEYHMEGRIGDMTSAVLSPDASIGIAGYLTMSAEGQLDYRAASDADYTTLNAETAKMKP